jgi:anti-sigma28 factor (negative regulator of flagellin synthesis)
MKIDPRYPQKVGGETTLGGPAKAGGPKGPKGSDGQNPARPSGTVSADGLVLTPRAEEFRQLRLRLQSLPDEGRSERVAQLKDLFEQGTYAVAGDRIAGAMLQDEPTASLLGLRPS